MGRSRTSFNVSHKPHSYKGFGKQNSIRRLILYVKKPNIEHLRIFGCVAFAKINAPHLRKLDDRSRMVINLGTQPGSKSYRVYDPVMKKVVVSRDVIFDEKKS